MYFSKILTTFLLTTFAAAAQSFSLLVIRSGSNVQYKGIVSHKESLYLSSSNETTSFILTNENSLYDPSSRKFVTVRQHVFVLSDTPDTGFGTVNGYLTYKLGGFSYDESWQLTDSGDPGIALRLWNPNEVANPQLTSTLLS